MILEAHELVLARGQIPILNGLSLQLNAGEVLAIGGPSGGGKTTALRVLLGLTVPQRGTVKLKGVPVSEGSRLLVPPEARNLAVVFQDLALWPHLTVRGNLSFGLTARGVPRKQQPERIEAALASVGLSGRASRYPGQLSGGEQQRVAIARALVLEPHAVLFDEPLSNLDVALKHDLLGLLREQLRARGLAAIYVTHDPREASALAHRVAIIEGGRVVQSGPPEALREAPLTDFVRAWAQR